MNREANFYKQALQQRTPFQDLDSQTKVYQALIYINRVVELAKALDVEFPVPPRLDSETKEDVYYGLFLVENALNKIYARNIFELDESLGAHFVALDRDWRAKITTYINYMKEAVGEADVEQQLRDAILVKINELQAEVDRERTKLQAGIDTLLAITEAIGEGAKKLEPARRLISSVVNSMSKLQKAETAGIALLPPPDKMGLPDVIVDSIGKESDGEVSEVAASWRPQVGEQAGMPTPKWGITEKGEKPSEG
jgi:hypothetical protein